MTKSWAAPLLAAVLLAGCGSEEVVTPRDAGVDREILGTWYPWDIPSYVPPGFDADSFPEATVTFKDDGTWTGSDGCNGQGGDYEITADGAFSAGEPGPSTRMGCANVPNATVLHSSTKAAVENGMLVLSANGTTTGRYLREPQASPSPSVSDVDR
ncbi:META domain-containing protein [Kineosporia sp. NBRC 101731]|uniref:META domain-containing protein n=1 Tax=Kineosporia sp. NBRC 101731 TaxID=3032199 RepID=UPI0024A4C94D|nr:META domain-containing protein [Kineosporia sp. NBRC 101731]GLY28799.1 hypothetical protein Kisp02_21640 [Kineosporia sp. NBRC 101731]